MAMYTVYVAWTTSISILYLSSIVNVFAHDPLNPFIVAQQTCPHANDMDQRLAKFAEMIYYVTNEIPMAQSRDDFENNITNYIFTTPNEHAAVIFPDTITESQSYFTYPQFLMGQLDMTKHTGWFSLKALLNGSDPGDPTPSDGFYGKPSNISIYDYLVNLPFRIKIVHGLTYYWCDYVHAWGFNHAAVYIKEKTDDPNICQPKTYIGAAEVFPTFKSTINAFGNEEWVLEEWGIFLDIYATQEAQLCDNKKPKQKAPPPKQYSQPPCNRANGMVGMDGNRLVENEPDINGIVVSYQLIYGVILSVVLSVLVNVGCFVSYNYCMRSSRGNAKKEISDNVL